jgi:hypothetical protein
MFYSLAAIIEQAEVSEVPQLLEERILRATLAEFDRAAVLFSRPESLMQRRAISEKRVGAWGSYLYHIGHRFEPEHTSLHRFASVNWHEVTHEISLGMTPIITLNF